MVRLKQNMSPALIILISVLVFFALFALYFEKIDQKNAYSMGKHEDGDSIDRTLYKLRICVEYDMKTIKWRRILLATGTAVTLLFLLVHRRLPEPREFLLYFVIIFMCLEISWRTYVSYISSDVVRCGEENLSHLRKEIEKMRSLIYNI